MKIRELLSKKSRWTQRVQARNRLGMWEHPARDSAHSFCLFGAATRCYGESAHRDFVMRLLSRGIRKLFSDKGYSSVTEFNDSQDTKFTHIKKLLEHVNV